MNLSLSVLLAATLLPGCQSSPLGVASLATPEDSVRYVSQPGTPSCIATVWHNGSVNIAAPVHTLAQDRSTFCRARATLAWSGTRQLFSVTGALCTSSPLPEGVTLEDGHCHLTLSFDETELTGLVDAVFQTPCGPATVVLPVTLVREIPEVPE